MTRKERPVMVIERKQGGAIMRTAARTAMAATLAFWVGTSAGIAAPATPPAPAPAPAAKAPAPTTEGTPATVIDDQKVETIIGQDVFSSKGEKMGPIVNMIVNRKGDVEAALIDFGGFLGVGSRQIAVDWRALRFAADGKDSDITVALTRDQVRLAPEYKAGQPLVVLGAPPPAPAAPAKPAASHPGTPPPKPEK
jgi:hypothetical protein